MLAAASAPAATKIWTAAVSTDWFNDLNWSPTGKPATGDTVILDINGTMNISAPLRFSGTFIWIRGGITSSSTGLGLATNTVMEIRPGNFKTLYCPLVNEGLIRLHDNSTLYLDNGFGTARFVNYGTVESLTDDGFLPSGTGGGRIENHGLFVKTGGAGATTLSAGIPLVNTGTVEARTGTIQIAAGTLSGSFIGAGVNHWTGGLVLAGTVNSSNVLINAQLAGVGATLSGNWTWQTGNFGPAADNNFTLATNSLLTLVPGNSKILVCPLTNHGTIRLTNNATLYLDHGFGTARLVNRNLLESTGDDAFSPSGTGGGRVENHALFRKRVGTGVTSLAASIPLVNFGTVEAQTGTIQIAAGTLTGNFTGAGVNHWLGSFALTGTVNSSNVLINAQLAGTDVTLTGNWTWQTGAWGPGGGYSFTMASNTLLTLIAGNSKILYCPLTNHGTLRLTGPTTLFLDHGYGVARLVNRNLLESTGDDAFSPSGTGGGRVENYGLLRKTGGAGTTGLAATIPLVNFGTVEAQTGTIQIGAGTLSGHFTGNGLNHWTGNLLALGTVNSSNVLINAHVSGTNVNFTGNWTWRTGNLGPATGNSFTVAAGARWTLVPGNSKYLYCPLTNLGTVRLTGNSSLYLDHGLGAARLVNLGLVDSTSDDLFAHAGTAGGMVENRASFTKSGGAGTTTVASGLLFLNTGTVTVQTNELNLQNGILTATFNGPGKTVLTGNHTLTGDLTVQNLEMQSGNFTSSSARLHGAVRWVTGDFYCQTPGAGATVAGNCVLTLAPGNYKYLYGGLTNLGIVRLTGSTALYLDNAYGNTRLVNLNLLDSTGNDLFAHGGTSGGVVENRATFTKSGGDGVTTVASGLLFLHTGTVNVQTQTLNLQNGILTATFNGPGKTVLTGNHTLTGDLYCQNLEMQSGNFTSASARLHGAVRWVTGLFYCQTADAGGTVAADGTLTLVPGNYKYLYGGLTNVGTIRLTGNTALYLDNAFGNTGLVNLGLLDSTGNDLFAYSGTANGIVDNRAIFTKSGGNSVTTVGSGLLFLNSSAATVNVQTQTLNLQNGILSGTFNGPGQTVLTGTHTLVGDLTAQNTALQSGSFTGGGAQLHGTFTWTTGSIFTPTNGPGMTLATDCTLTMVPGNYKYLYGSLTNRGALHLTGNTALYLDNGFGHARLANYGLVESLGDDLFSQTGTSGATLENRGYWRKSAGTGSTTFASGLGFVHAGALEAFKGAFAVNGGAFIQAGGTMSVRLNSASDYGRINFTGAAPLGGGLAAQVGPGYSPTIGSQFVVVTSQATIGAFATYNLAPGYTWSVLVTNTFTRLTVTGVNAPGASALFTRIAQVAPQDFDLHLLVQPNRPYHMEARNSLDPDSAWQYLGPFSSTTSNYVYRHTALGALPPQQFFRAVSP